MYNPDEIILEIKLDLIVDDEERRLEIPVPFDYDGADVLKLVMEDLLPRSGEEGAIAPATPDPDGIVEIKGAMAPDAFEDWQMRARDLQEIKWAEGALDDTGLTPGEWPGICDERTGEPTTLMIDETIDHDLHNAEVVFDGRKATFKAMRETSGASQAALADALGVNARTVKRWETPGQSEPPRDAWSLVEAWRADAASGARWHVCQAEELRDDFHEAYVLTLYRSQDELDADLAPLLAQAPSYRWQDALAEARERDVAEGGDGSHLEVERPYTNFPGTRSYWRANAAARLAAAMMDERGIAYGFAYPGELDGGWGGRSVWVPRADVQRIEGPGGVVVACGMR